MVIYDSNFGVPNAERVVMVPTVFGSTPPPPSPPPSQSIVVSVNPGTVTLGPSQGYQFTATVTGTTNTQVTWSESPSIGTQFGGGYYLAPATITSPQTVTLTATSVADNTKSASATITLIPPASNVSSVAVTVSPMTLTLGPSQGYQFTANVTGAANTAVTWSYSPAIGTQYAGGYYLAPASIWTTQTITVTATSVANTSKTASATITLLPPAGQTVAVSVSPTSASFGPGQGTQFTATVVGTQNQSVVWSMSPAVGALYPGGFYLAPSQIQQTQTITLKATSAADSSKTATAVVTIHP
jgi:hypothetical protein